jgi:hypothetical protein
MLDAAQAVVEMFRTRNITVVLYYQFNMLTCAVYMCYGTHLCAKLHMRTDRKRTKLQIHSSASGGSSNLSGLKCARVLTIYAYVYTHVILCIHMYVYACTHISYIAKARRYITRGTKCGNTGILFHSNNVAQNYIECLHIKSDNNEAMNNVYTCMYTCMYT